MGTERIKARITEVREAEGETLPIKLDNDMLLYVRDAALQAIAAPGKTVNFELAGGVRAENLQIS